MIRLTRPVLDEAELRAVQEVLESGMLVQGPVVARFEAAVASRCGRARAVATSSGTSALHLALVALGVGPGDEVLCPGLTWPSPAHAIRLVGARPVLVDVDPDEWNATPEALAAARTERTRAAIVIDQFGNPARWEGMGAALEGLSVVEDAACAIGSRLGDRACGSFGRVSCLSFHPRKVLTTGEGGMCLTDEPALAERIASLRNHGQEAPGRFVEAAGNHRLTEVAAALGLAQLDKLDAMVAERRRRATVYQQALPELIFQRAPTGGQPNQQTLGALLAPGTKAQARDALVAELRARGIEAGLLSFALSRVPSVGASEPLPVSEDLVDRGLSLPLFPTMRDSEQETVIDTLRELLR